jgi:RimJ/RimL family protein N-acetyltransferase
MNVVETARLRLRWLREDDAPFFLTLLNDPGWIEFIGDRGVRTVEAAREYMLNGPIAMYAREGFGLYLTERKEDGAPLGICGLIKRAGLDDVDIGFAFLPQFGGQGYAHEAAAAALDYGLRTLGLKRVVAITMPANKRSIRLLEKIGLKFERMIRMPNDSEELMLMATS